MRTDWWSISARSYRTRNTLQPHQRAIMSIIQSSSMSDHIDMRTPGKAPMRAKAPVLMSILAGVLLTPALAAAESKPSPAGLSAAQIVEKHVAARGADAVGHRQARCGHGRRDSAEHQAGPARSGRERQAGGARRSPGRSRG